MSSRWTKEQLEAITSRNRHILVAAAAGAGKTAVLVERIIKRITDPETPVDVDRLLVVTFTAAAAAEMRERIGLALTKAMENDPESVVLQRQLALLQRANISTLHSFCLELIRQYFYRLELDPVFRVADEAEAALLQLDVLEDVFEHRFTSSDESFLALVDCYGGRMDDSGLQELVLELYRFSRSTPRPAEWLSELTNNFNLPEDAHADELPWFCIIKNRIQQELSGIQGMLRQAVQLTELPDGPSPYMETLKYDLEMLDDLSRACATGWDKLYRQFLNTKFSKLKSCGKGEADEELKKAAQKIRNDAKSRVQKIQGRYFKRPTIDLLNDLRAMAPLLGSLAELVKEFADSYRQAKVERGIVDFNDLEHYALQILAELNDHNSDGDVLGPSPVALELHERFAEVLVDEYQDINAVQEAIINLVVGTDSTGPDLFMVGDVKQSIYRFRLAEPGLFLEKYDRLAASQVGTEKLINLTKNFRSRQGVIEAVNFVFQQIMSPEVGELAYDQKAQLVCGADYPTFSDDTCSIRESTELHLIETETALGEDAQLVDLTNNGAEERVFGDSDEDLDAVQVEARTAARRIINLMEDGYMVFDREWGEYRHLQYRDVVVLLRATTGRANVFVEEFGKLGIPAYADLNTGYFEATEVETVLSLLKIIDNPRQDVPLAAVMRSPVTSFNSEDLAQIRLCGGKGDFYDALVMTTLEGPEALAGRLAGFLAQLDQWRTKARRSSLPELIWALYRETGYYDFVGGLPGGSQRQANLRALYHRAEQYESTAYRGLFRFLRFIERMRDNAGDMGTARSFGENENLVRIMSIHKSKGLEYPVVIMAGLGKRFNFTDLNKNVLMHRELGLGPQLVDPEKRITYPTVAKLALREKLRAEALAEEMRVLYVAMTRAREKLILMGSVRSLEDNITKWCNAVNVQGRQLPAWLTAGAANYLDWIVPALVRHRDGAPLRELSVTPGGPAEEILNHASNWSVHLHDRTGWQRNKGDLPSAKNLDYVCRLELVPPAGTAKQVHTYLSWQYPYRHLQGLAARETVTGLKKLVADINGVVNQMNDFEVNMAARPLFVQKTGGLTASERGQALHLVMQLLELEKKLDNEGIREQLAAMVMREQISREQAASVDPETIASFFASSLGQRLIRSREVYRELPFTIALPAERLYKNLTGINSKEKVLVQGIIDCLADEGDGLLLIDYKTDRYTPETLAQVVERYRVQLKLYAEAVESITKRRVKAKYLYMFYGGDILLVE